MEHLLPSIESINERKLEEKNKYEELKSVTGLDSLVIMFKHCVTFEQPITYDFLYDNGIVNGYIQAPTSIEKQDLEKIIIEGKSQNMIEIV